MFISSAFAQTPAGGADSFFGQLGQFGQLLPLVLMFVVLYFLMIRPQMKKQKEHRKMVEALTKGDEVATAGGMLGRITKVADSQLGLEVSEGVEVQIQRSAVVQVLPKGSLK